MIDHIKSFRKINCPGQCAEWGTGLIKALSYFMQEVRGQIWWSGWNGSHVGWVREEVSEVPVAEGILRP